ncbi:helix-turn-helix domain-containing protein [Thiofilum flexile]|uniref:helix-turn-helix domain-containing protein n=1 Tax=Thiofilum flexile TaxID=125627 RepID=UPI00037148A1|nr:hypothetical protein [Thiofilum flexile]
MGMAFSVKTAMDHWGFVAPMLTMPGDEAEYEALVDALDEVLDAGGADEVHPLASLAERMGDLIAAYEDKATSEIEIMGSGIDALSYLMATQGISQAGLPEVASQGVMSEILSGKRELNIRQIRALSERFGVPAQVFI